MKLGLITFAAGATTFALAFGLAYSTGCTPAQVQTAETDVSKVCSAWLHTVGDAGPDSRRDAGPDRE